jgi:hypothetical protein
MKKKTIVIVMNCHGEEIITYLNKIPEITVNFDIVYITTYLNFNNSDALLPLTTCDILITHNVKNYEPINFTNLCKKIKPTCKVIKMEFVRFHGFWPLEDQSDHLLHFDEEISKNERYEDYMDTTVDSTVIQDHFNKCLDLLQKLDQDSDVHFYDFFVENYRKHRLFRDGWHPTHFFYRHLVKEIVALIDSQVDLSIIDEIHVDYGFGHKFRYRHILPCVQECLLISSTFDEERFSFLDKLITKRDLFSFIKSVPCDIKDYIKLFDIFMQSV